MKKVILLIAMMVVIAGISGCVDTSDMGEVEVTPAPTEVPVVTSTPTVEVYNITPQIIVSNTVIVNDTMPDEIMILTPTPVPYYKLEDWKVCVRFEFRGKNCFQTKAHDKCILLEDIEPGTDIDELINEIMLTVEKMMREDDKAYRLNDARIIYKVISKKRI